MKTIAECRESYIDFIAEKIQTLTNEKLSFEKATAKAEHILKNLDPVFKKLHLTDFNNISICAPATRKTANISISFNTDEKFKYYKKDKYNHYWWKTNEKRVFSRIDKMIAAINEVEPDIKININQFSLVDEGEQKKSVLMDISFIND